MNDLISRQAAITAIQKAYADTEGGTDKCAVWKNVGLTNALHIMQDLPSAQPEIIRCKDCRYSIDEYGDGECYCKRPSREIVWIGKRWDFFCAAARLKMEVEHDIH